MKNFLLLMVLSAICLSTNAQKFGKNRPATLIDKGTPLGFYVGVSTGTLNAINDPYLKVGGYAGLQMDRKFTVGVGGFAYSNDLAEFSGDTSGMFGEGGYGGLFFEPVAFSEKAIHITFPVLVGAGSTAFYEYDPSFDPWYERFENYHHDFHSSRNYLFVEPGVNIEFSLVRFLRMGVGASYMMSSAFSENSRNDNIDGLNWNMNIRLGWF